MGAHRIWRAAIYPAVGRVPPRVPIWAVASLLCTLLATLTLAGCAGTSASSKTPTPATGNVAISINPTSATVAAGATQQFSAMVTGTSNTSVIWSASGGLISTTGLYTAGSTGGSFSATATSMADGSKSAQAAVTVNGPLPPAGTAASITKDGITWSFSQPVPVGQFVNGDYYVVGPVTITSISPPPTTSSPYMNGSVVDLPTANGKSGFDSRLNDGTDES